MEGGPTEEYPQGTSKTQAAVLVIWTEEDFRVTDIEEEATDTADRALQKEAGVLKEDGKTVNLEVKSEAQKREEEKP
ncbi:hypothetical protein NDU88_007365 [Pleurodeles waltl]|uniref:Uncharacterized protein n=1 Tax=Pleurodeles waltl TaxID=8319 RepID=A0AAV7QRP4_PLEWA|nr:hypothetical protein NDU88_007365 [Pleurodeles waltl]